MQRLVYKVCTVADWQAALVQSAYVGSADDLRDGFIHLSTAEQLPGTLARYFAGQADLSLLSVDAASLGDSLKWEASRGGQLFPHLYAPLALTLVICVRSLPIGSDGNHVLPEDLR